MTAKDDKAQALRVLVEELNRIADTRGYMNNPRLAFQPIATELLALRDEVKMAKGVIAADDQRLEEAAIKVYGEHVWGCDTPDHMADTILALRSALQAATEALDTAFDALKRAGGLYHLGYNEANASALKFMGTGMDSTGLTARDYQSKADALRKQIIDACGITRDTAARLRPLTENKVDVP